MLKKSYWRAGAPALVASLLLASAASAQVLVQSVSTSGDTPTALENDFTRINDAVQGAADNETITLEGDFDWSEANAMASYTASQSTEEFGYAWNESLITAIILPGGVSGVTIEAHPSGASVKGFARTDTNGEYDQAFIYLGEGNTNGWTIDGLELRDFERTIVFNDEGGTVPGTAHNTTIRNCTIAVGNYQMIYGVGIELRGGYSNNLLIENNTFEILVNTGLPGFPGYPETIGVGWATYGIRQSGGGNEVFRNVQIINNAFKATLDPTSPNPGKATNRGIGIFDQTRSTVGMSTISGNTFDGRIPNPEGPGVTSGLLQGIMAIAKPYNPPASYADYSNNTFINVLRCYDTRYNSGGGTDTLLLEGNTFTDCGWSGPGFPPGYHPSTYTGVISTGAAAPDTLEYQPAIANASPTIYSTGGYNVLIDLATDWNGTTGIPMLNTLAEDPRGFEMIPRGSTGWAQGGVLFADVVAADAPAVTYERTIAETDNAWQYTDRWVRPTPPVDDNGTDLSGIELAFGYNATADPVPTGDTTKVQGLTTYTLTSDEEFAVGTIVDTDLTILSDQTKAGPDENRQMYAITPVSKNPAGTIFVVQPGASLTIRNVIVSGDNPAIPGLIDVYGAVELTDETSTVSIENCVVSNFIGAGIRTYRSSSVNIQDSSFDNSGFAVFQPVSNAPATLTVTDSIFGRFANAATFNFNSPLKVATMTGNSFNDASNIFLINRMPANNFTLTGNLFPNCYLPMEFGIGNLYDLPTTIDISGNWHGNIYGLNSQMANGIITGDAVAAVVGNDVGANVVAGERKLDIGKKEIIIETGIVGRFDTDLDAKPDAFELAPGSTTSYTVRDLDNDGYPDGVEESLGTDPNDGGSFPAAPFVIDQDDNDNGYVDWYEDALLDLTGIDVFLGDILRNGGVGLTDAVRSLQIVNGALAKTQVSGDLNANDVVGSGPDSLANPLQILRFQAGVRESLPALPGID